MGEVDWFRAISLSAVGLIVGPVVGLALCWVRYSLWFPGGEGGLGWAMMYPGARAYYFFWGLIGGPTIGFVWGLFGESLLGLISCGITAILNRKRR